MTTIASHLLCAAALLCACAGRTEYLPSNDLSTAGQCGLGSQDGQPGQGGARAVPSEGEQPQQVLDAGRATDLDAAAPIPSPSDCPMTIPSPAGYHPVALYRLEESGGTQVLDSSGWIDDSGSSDLPPAGTIIGGGRGSGACGRGVTLDGTDTRLELRPVGDVFASGIAVELWLRPARMQADLVHLIGDGGGGLASFQLVLDDGVPLFRLSDRNTGEWRELLRSPLSVEAATWQHLRATYDTNSGDAELLLNGSKVVASNRLLPVEASYNRIYVGAVENISPCCSIANEFVGDIDELGVWAK